MRPTQRPKSVVASIRNWLQRFAFACIAGCLWGSGPPAIAAPPGVSPKSAFGTDVTDTWWNPSESGWGMQMVQTGSFVFVTVYVYGADGKPTWFGGGVTSTDGATYTGKLYVTTGPYYGGPFNPSAVTVREAGTMTFQSATADTAQFSYSVDGVAVTKTVQRQPLTLDDYNGAYAAILTQATTNCTDPTKDGSLTAAIGVQIAQNDTTMYVFIANPSGDNCTAGGSYSQLGRNGRFEGAYTCESGDSGIARLSELNNRSRLFSGRIDFQSVSIGCHSIGWLMGVVPE